jgi:hypothetical protein
LRKVPYRRAHPEACEPVATVPAEKLLGGASYELVVRHSESTIQLRRAPPCPGALSATVFFHCVRRRYRRLRLVLRCRACHLPLG